MTKIEFDTEKQEISVTRGIGKTGDGAITIDREGGGAIEINLGVASLGITTDYGGAISAGIAGQNVTWGREGGNIHLGVGGLAVDVEARDCVVTETKSIFGQIVAQRSYRDPGCKPEPEPEPQQPPPFDPVKGIQLEDGADSVYVVLQGFFSYFERRWYTDTVTWENNVTVSNVQKNISITPDSSSTKSLLLPFTVAETYKTERFQQGIGGGYIQGNIKSRTLGLEGSGTTTDKTSLRLLATNKPCYMAIINEYAIRSWATVNGEQAPLWSSTSAPLTIILYGSKTNCKEYIKTLQNSINYPDGSYSRSIKYIIKQVIPVGEQKPPPPFLPTGNKPPMNNCCEEVLDILEDIKEAFGIDRLLKDKFPVSNTFMAPGCDPTSTTQAKNYYEIAQCVIRMMAHGMIFEPRVNIKDADAVKAGDQEFKARYINATGWASAVAEALLEVKDDGNVSTNMDIRNAFAVTQTMVGLSDAIYRLNALIDSIGVELIPVVETVDTPYNLQIQIGKGFGEGNERQIDLNTDEATEKLLPELLKVKTNKIKTVTTHPRSRSLKDILESIESNLPSSNNA